ncbi:saccharopine dehydrogenase [Plantibacter sp. YIM 135347]|uniref:saccharopine dehydrogenase n=1 Tax=Plantibacter sp. YIM 135347 TaxID=3423919 RepID=UPI003D33AB57
MSVLVLGGYGAVGAAVVARLRERGVDARSAGRDERRADVVIDLDEPGLAALEAAAGRVDVVVNASGREDVALAAVSTDARAAFVEISATSGYLDALAALDPHSAIVLGVGLAPGLTNLLAHSVARRSTGALDVGIVLGAADAHGPAATAWTYGLLGRSFDDPGTGDSIRNFSRGRRFTLPDGRRRRLLRTDFADQHTLTRELGRPVRTSFGTDDAASTALLALLTRVPGAGRLPAVHLPGGDRWVVIAEASSGERAWAVGHGQSEATGLVAALAARSAASLPAGVHQVQDAVTLDAVARVAEVNGIVFGES